jgi:hypothetical protein
MIRLAAALVILLLAPADLVASALGAKTIQRWQLMDRCTQKAQTEFPDFTAEANAKREAALQQCLSGSNLPPRQPLSPDQPGH